MIRTVQTVIKIPVAFRNRLLAVKKATFRVTKTISVKAIIYAGVLYTRGPQAVIKKLLAIRNACAKTDTLARERLTAIPEPLFISAGHTLVLVVTGCCKKSI